MAKTRQKKHKFLNSKKQKSPITIAPIFWKIGTFFLVGAFLYGVLYNHKGYKWAVDNLVISNIKHIYSNPDLTLDQRYEAKIGFNYRYLKYVKDNTPKDAIILWPAPADFLKDGSTKPFHDQYINEKIYANYFLYPRKVISVQDTANIYYPQATYLAIVNGKGYEKLPYLVNQQEPYTVAPLNP